MSHQREAPAIRPRSVHKYRGTTKRYVGAESAVLGVADLYEHHRQGLRAVLTAAAKAAQKAGAVNVPTKRLGPQD